MANSFIKYPGDGANRTFSIPFPYLSRDHIDVSVGAEPVDFVFLTDASIETVVAVAEDAELLIRRVTPVDAPQVTFSKSTLKDADLNAASRQSLYGLQEMRDTALEGLESTAELAAQQAQTAAGESDDHRADAEAAKTSAESAEAKAAKWADEDVDEEVEPGLYSAKHHAAKSADHAADAADHKDEAVDAQASAEAAATAASTYADAAAVAGDIYADTAAGIAATSNGDHFSVKSANSIYFTELWKNNAGVAEDTGKRFPSGAAIEPLRATLRTNLSPTLEDGSPTPPYGFVDEKTGYYLWWVDANGIAHAPAVDAQLAAMQDTIDAADLSALQTLPDVAGKAAVTTEDGEDSLRVDDDGTTRIAKLVRGDDPDNVLVEINTTEVMLYARVGPPEADFWLRHRWELTTGETDDVWRWQDTYLTQRRGANWDFVKLFMWIGGGVQDIVCNEKQVGGVSVDTGETGGGFIGPSHGYEYKTRELLIYVDGVAVPALKPARYLAREVKLVYQANIFRPRAVFDHNTATVLAVVDKTWTFTARDQLKARHRITNGVNQWTGFQYFPLFTVPLTNNSYTVATHVLRDAGFKYFAVPSGLTSGGGSEPEEVTGVREVRYVGAHGSLNIRVSDPLRYSAAGFRKHTGRLEFGVDTHRIKGPPDADVKSYWLVGGDVVGADTYRLNAGDILEREFHLQILKG